MAPAGETVIGRRDTTVTLEPSLFQAKRKVRDPNTDAIAAVWICNECVPAWRRHLPRSPR